MYGKFRKTIIGILTAACVFCIGMFCLSERSEAKAEAVWENVSLESVYGFGSKIVLPERKVTVNGESLIASSSVVFPDGTATRSGEITLSVCGEYVVTYTATDSDGRIYYKEETFSVNNKMILYGEDSSVTYGKPVLSAEKEGLMVRLAQGDALSFTALIDVSDTSKNDVLVEAFATPDEVGVMDFERLIYTFTDSLDPSICLRVSARQSAEGASYPYTYFLAGGNGQPLSGWESAWSKLHVDNIWGTFTSHSFSCLYKEEGMTPDRMPMSVRYDSSELAVYAGNEMVIDLDNPKYFTTLWKGFPSGKVRLSVAADSYNNLSANFCISAVRGIDLKSEFLIDSEGPVITVNNGYENMPEARTGGTYPVPGASAKDDYSGECEVRTSVWYCYATPSAILVNITDGCFKAERKGYYAIVYEARDYAGNESKTVLWVHAGNTVAPVGIDVDGAPMSVTTGEYVRLPQAVATGGSGDVSLRVLVTYRGEDTGEMLLPGDGYRFEREGKYTLTYIAEDYIFQTCEVSVEVTVERSEQPVFTEEAWFPKVLVAGSEYTLPHVYASDYSSGVKVLREAEAVITDALGSRRICGGEVFSPYVENNGDEIGIRFLCGDSELAYTLPVIVPFTQTTGRPRFNVENYMFGENIGIERTSDGTIVSAYARENEWTFALSQLVGNFTLDLYAVAGKSDFEALKITLTDERNEGISVSAYVFNKGAGSTFTVGNESVSLDSGFTASAASRRFLFRYESGTFKIGNAGIVAVRCDNGDPFDGFPSNKAYVRVEAVGASAGAQYMIASINDHTLDNAASDRVAPRITVLGDYGGSYAMGTTVTLPAAVAADVVDPNVDFTLTVYAPDKTIASDVNGVLLKEVDPGKEYTLLLTRYGQYSVSYYAADVFNTSPNVFSSGGYAISVEDEQAPVVEILSGYTTSVKAGENIIFPDFNVKDNYSENENVVVTKWIFTPSGRLVRVSDDSNAVTVTEAGVYEIRIMAMDEQGNVTVWRGSVMVTGEEI